MLQFNPAPDRFYIPVPQGFDWTPPVNVYRNKQGLIKTDFDVSRFRHVGAGKTYYVNLTTGNDSNDGLTAGAAFKSLYKAIEAVDVDIIYVADGIYPRLNAVSGRVITRDISIIATGSTCVISSHDVISWTKTDGYTNVYHGTRSGVLRVFDATVLDTDGDYTEYTNRVSIADVDTNPGSWFQDGTTIYVHTPNSRAADSNVRAYIGSKGIEHVGDKSIYLEGIRFEGSQYPLRVENTAEALTPKVYAKNCSFKYGTSGNGIYLLGTELAIFQNCIAALNTDDGFNYHEYNGRDVNAIEINCIGRKNGVSGDTDNGSTMHDGGKVMRINGSYYKNKGPNVADVSDNSKSWNIGCKSYDSEATTSGQNADFVTQAGTDMWLDDCISWGSNYSYSIDTGGELFVRNMKSFGAENIVGTKQSY